MAIQETRTLPAPFIETLGQDYAKQITGLTATPIDTSKFAPQVAGQNQLQQQAATLTGQGIGAYQPYIAEAQRLGGVDSTTGKITQTGYEEALKPFMSPYQTQLIDTSLAEFDRQRQMQKQQISDAAVRSGNFGGGREGVQLAEFSGQTDRNRGFLQAQLLQQGFQQAQQAAQQAQAQQLGLASLFPGLQQQDISILGQVGATQQAQEQAEKDAAREAARAAAFEPYERLGFYGSGVTGLMGGYPGQYQFSSVPNPSPLQTALGTGATLAGIYGALKPSSPFNINFGQKV
jgi:hypothetical protein